MNKRKKKGFTVVELVIVIAVVAILAAVLIPTLSNVINKAKISSDNQLIINMNKALYNDNISGKLHPTMQDALDCAEEAGYMVERVEACARGKKILWDSKNDVFCYLDEKTGEVSYSNTELLTYNPEQIAAVDYFVISNEPDMKYSTYLYEALGSDLEIITDKGIDTGKCYNIKKVVYDNSKEVKPQEVIIRTGDANIDLEVFAFVDEAGNGDTIKHYGDAATISIQRNAYSSYHEFGAAVKVIVAAGRYVAEKGSIIAQLHIDPNMYKDGEGQDIIIELLSESVTGTITNTVSAEHLFKLTAEDGSYTVFLNISLSEGGKTAKVDIFYANGATLTYADTYSGVYDKQAGTITIQGVAKYGEKTAAPYAYKYCSNGHTWKTVEGLNVKVCEVCGGIQFTTKYTAEVTKKGSKDEREYETTLEKNPQDQTSGDNGQKKDDEYSQHVVKVHDHELDVKSWDWNSSYTQVTLTLECNHQDCEYFHCITVGPENISCDNPTITCKEGGIKTYSAAIVFLEKTYKTEKKVEIPKSDKHAKIEFVAAKAAVCDEPGNNAHYVCTLCGTCFSDEAGKNELATKDVVLAKLGHKMEYTKELLATCIDPGNSQFWYCSQCKCYFADKDGNQKLSGRPDTKANGHSLVETAYKQESCLVDGNNAYYTCSTCKKVFVPAGTGVAGKETTVAEQTIKHPGHKVVYTYAGNGKHTGACSNTQYNCTYTEAAESCSIKNGACEKCKTSFGFYDDTNKVYLKDAADLQNYLNTNSVKGDIYLKLLADVNSNLSITVKKDQKFTFKKNNKAINANINIVVEEGGHAKVDSTWAPDSSWSVSGDYSKATVKLTWGQAIAETYLNKITITATVATTNDGKQAKCNEDVIRTHSASYKYNDNNTYSNNFEQKLARLAHTIGAQFTAKAKTCTSDGNKAYYQCSVCQSYFLDAAGKQTATWDDIKIPASHNEADYVFNSNGTHQVKCKDCKALLRTEDCDNKHAERNCTLCGGYRVVAKTESGSYFASFASLNSYIQNATSKVRIILLADVLSASEIRVGKDKEVKLQLNSVNVNAPLVVRLSSDYKDFYFESNSEQLIFSVGAVKWTWNGTTEAEAKFSVYADLTKAKVIDNLYLVGEAKVEHRVDTPATCTHRGTMLHEAYVRYGSTKWFENEYTSCKTEDIAIKAHNLAHQAANPAKTCTETGTIEYWYCDGCECFYSDANGANEIAASSITVPALGAHTWTNYKHVEFQDKHTAVCSVCKYEDTLDCSSSGACSACGAPERYIFIRDFGYHCGSIAEFNKALAKIAETYTGKVETKLEKSINDAGTINIPANIQLSIELKDYDVNKDVIIKVAKGGSVELCNDLAVIGDRLKLKDTSFTWGANYQSATYTAKVKRGGTHDYEASLTIEAEATLTGSVVTTATCSVDGQKQWTATAYVNGAQTAVNSTLQNLGKNSTNHVHGYTENVGAYAATCVKTGFIGDTKCQDCGYVYQAGVGISATGHTTSTLKNKVNATCLADGYSGDMICNACGANTGAGHVETAKGHTFGSIVQGTAATCCADGTKSYYYCSTCNKKFSSNASNTTAEITDLKIAANGNHSLETRNYKDATCTDKGYTGDQYCTVGKKVITSGSEKDALGHAWVNPQHDDLKLTHTYSCSRCTAKNTEVCNNGEEKKCTACNFENQYSVNGTYFAANISELNRALTKIKEDGATSITVVKKHHFYSSGTIEVPAGLNVKFELEDNEPQSGVTIILNVGWGGSVRFTRWNLYGTKNYNTYGTSGDNSLDESDLVWNWTAYNSVVSAKAFTKGYGNYDGAILASYAVSMNSGEITTVATCKTNGQKTFTASVNIGGTSYSNKCSSYTLDFGKNENNHVGGTEVTGASDPTCTTAGSTGTTVCKGCGVTLQNASSIKATGHQHTREINAVAVTCVTNGKNADIYCDDCNTTISTGSTIYANGQHVKDTEVAANSKTCTTDGNVHYYTCKNCTKKFSDSACTQEISNVVIDKSHTVGSWQTEVAATCCANGTKAHYYCSTCKKNLASDKQTVIDITISATGNHDLRAASQDGKTVTFRCTTSGCTAIATKQFNTYTVAWGVVKAKASYWD